MQVVIGNSAIPIGSRRRTGDVVNRLENKRNRATGLQCGVEVGGCEQHLAGRYELEVIDIHEHANLARDEQIVAVPTLIKRLPLPLRRLVGDMSDLNKVLFGLDLRMREQ